MANPHPVFGELVTRRSATLPAKLVVLPFAIMAALLAATSIGMWRAASAMRPGSGQAAMREDAMVTAIVAGVLGLLALVVTFLVSRTVEFYRKGVVVRRFGLIVKRLDFADLERHMYKRTHVHRLGAYAGSHVLLALRSTRGNTVRYRTIHKQNLVNRGRLFNGQYEMVGRDPIDNASYHAATFIARKWSQRLGAGESVPWTTFATLTPDGVAAWDGPAKGTIALYAELDRAEITARSITLVMRSGQPFLTLPSTDANAIPGLLVARERIAEALRTASADL